MGDTERPIPERDGDQEEQAAHLTRTGNGPTVDNEGELLADRYGSPDMAGYYSQPEPADSGDAEPADDDSAESADQDAAPAPAADSSKGGESA